MGVDNQRLWNILLQRHHLASAARIDKRTQVRASAGSGAGARRSCQGVEVWSGVSKRKSGPIGGKSAIRKRVTCREELQTWWVPSGTRRRGSCGEGKRASAARFATSTCEPRSTVVLCAPSGLRQIDAIQHIRDSGQLVVAEPRWRKSPEFLLLDVRTSTPWHLRLAISTSRHWLRGAYRARCVCSMPTRQESNRVPICTEFESRPGDILGRTVKCS